MKHKFTEEAIFTIFAQSRDVFRHRFTSKAGKRRAALLMYACEAVLSNNRNIISLAIPEAAKERFPKETFKGELLL